MSDIQDFKHFEGSERAKKIGQIDPRWDMLEVGRSFVIDNDKPAIANLRNKAWYMGKKLGKRFTVVDRKDYYEVYRRA